MAEGLGEIPADWRAVYQLLQSGEYEQVADLLAATVRISEPVLNPLLAATVEAARQICLACVQCQADVAWYDHARTEALHREQQLRQQVQLLLDRMMSQGSADSTTANAAIEFPVIVPKRPAQTPHLSLRQRIQQLFEQGKRLVLPIGDPPLLPGQSQATPSTFLELPQAEPVLKTQASTLPEPTQPADMPAPGQTVESPVPEEVATEVGGPLAGEVAELATPETEPAIEPPVPPEEPSAPGIPTLTIYCLGAFRVYQDDQLIGDWPSGKGLSIFKYLVTHRERPVAKEVLMELFWADASPEAARNNLNVAIYGLRRALRKSRPDFSHLLFQDDFYLLNPELEIWVDVEEFAQHQRVGQVQEQQGDQTVAIHEYQAAQALYGGEFLEEDRYDDWPLAQRRRLQDEYLDLLDRLSRYYLEHHEYNACVEMVNKMLSIDSCREDAHCRLMRCYSRQGYLNLALRQYHLCEEALKRELDVPPGPSTQKLWAQIRRRQPV